MVVIQKHFMMSSNWEVHSKTLVEPQGQFLIVQKSGKVSYGHMKDHSPNRQ